MEIVLIITVTRNHTLIPIYTTCHCISKQKKNYSLTSVFLNFSMDNRNVGHIISVVLDRLIFQISMLCNDGSWLSVFHRGIVPTPSLSNTARSRKDEHLQNPYSRHKS